MAKSRTSCRADEGRKSPSGARLEDGGASWPANGTGVETPGSAPLLNQHERPAAIHWRILLLCWLGWLSAFCTLMVFFYLSGLYRLDLALDDRGVAWIKALAIGATGAGGLVFGVLGDRWGRRNAMVLSLLLCIAGVAGAAAAASGSFMGACAALAGFGIGGQWASGQTLVGETVPPKLRGRFGAMAQSGAPLGLALATLGALVLGPHIGWRWVFVLTLAPAALIPATLLLVPESDVWSSRRERVRVDQVEERAKLIELFAPDVRRVFLVVFLLTLLSMANYWFTVSWLPDFMQRTWNLTLGPGHWTLVFVTGSLAGYFLFALAAERIGRRPAFSLFCGMMAAGTAMLTVFESAIRDWPALVLLFAFIAGVGTGFWSIFGPLYVELFPTRVRTTASGICMNVSRGFQFLAPLLVVQVGGEGLRSGVALAALFAAGAGLAIWLLPDRPGRPIDID